MKRTVIGICFGAVLCGVVLYAAAPNRIMLLDGESGGPYHKWQLTTPVLKKQLEETGLFQVDVVTAPPAGGDFQHLQARFQEVRGRRLQLRRAGQPLVAGIEDFLRTICEGGRRCGDRSRRRQRLPRLGSVQRHDRSGRLAGTQRKGGAVLVLQGWQADLRPFAGKRRRSRQPGSLPDDRSRRQSSDRERPAASLDAPGRRIVQQNARAGKEYDGPGDWLFRSGRTAAADTTSPC